MTSRRTFAFICLLATTVAVIRPVVAAEKAPPVTNQPGAAGGPPMQLNREQIDGFVRAYAGDDRPKIEVIWIDEHGRVATDARAGWLTSWGQSLLGQEGCGAFIVQQFKAQPGDAAVLSGDDGRKITSMLRDRTEAKIVMVWQIKPAAAVRGNHEPLDFTVSQRVYDIRRGNDAVIASSNASWWSSSERLYANRAATSLVVQALKGYTDSRAPAGPANPAVAAGAVQPGFAPPVERSVANRISVKIHGLTTRDDRDELVKRLSARLPGIRVVDKAWKENLPSTFEVQGDRNADLTAVAEAIEFALANELDIACTIENAQDGIIEVGAGNDATVTRALRRRFAEAVQLAQAPPICLIVGGTDADARVGGVADLISTELADELTEAGVHLENDMLSAEQKLRALQNVAANGDPALGAAIAGGGAPRLRIYVAIGRADVRGQFPVRVLLAAPGQARTIKQFSASLPAASQESVKKLVGVSANRLYHAYIKDTARPKNNLLALDLIGFDDAAACFAFVGSLQKKLPRDTAPIAPPIAGVSLDKAVVTEVRGNVTFAELAVAAMAAADEQGLAFEVYSADTSGVRMRLGQKVEVPGWYRLTEDDARKYTTDKQRLADGMKASRLASANLGIFLGSINADGTINVDPHDVRLDAISADMSRQLQRAGLRVVNPGTMQTNRQRLLQHQGQFHGNAAILAALQEGRDIDVAVLGAASIEAGALRMQCRLVDVRTGRFIGSVNFPLDESQTSIKFRVTDEPSSVARYVTGTLLDCLARQKDDPRELNVFVKDAASIEEVLAVSEVFSHDTAVTSVERLTFEFGVGSFRLRYKGSAELLLRRLLREKQNLPFELGTDLANAGVWELQLKPPANRTPTWTLRTPPASASSSPTPAKPERLEPIGGGSNWAVIVGINNYPAPNHPLQCAVPDAVLMQKSLVKFCGYPQRQVLLLADGVPGAIAPTSQNILSAITEVARLASPNDTITFFFSGHGNVVTLETNAGEQAKASVLGTIDPGGRVSVADVRRILRESKATRRLMVLDTCHSGSDFDAPFIRQQMDLPPAEHEGIATLASCRASESSFESPEDGNGVFTKWLARGLAGEAAVVDKASGEHVVEVDYLYHYLFANVPQDAKRVSGKDQHPFILEAKSGQIVLSRFRGVK